MLQALLYEPPIVYLITLRAVIGTETLIERWKNVDAVLRKVAEFAQKMNLSGFLGVHCDGLGALYLSTAQLQPMNLGTDRT